MNETNDRASHDEILSQLSALLDGELQPEQADRVRRHIESCPGCAAAWTQTRSLSNSLKSLPREPMPASLKQQVLAGARSRPLLRRPWILASAASAAMLILLSAVVLRLELPEPESLVRQKSPAASSEKKDAAEPLPRRESHAAPSGKESAAEGQSDRDDAGPVTKPAEPSFAPALEVPESVMEDSASTPSAPPTPPTPIDAAESEEIGGKAISAPMAKSAPSTSGTEAAGEISGLKSEARAEAPLPARWSTRAVPGPDGELSLEPLTPDVASDDRKRVAGRTGSYEAVLTFLAETGPAGSISRAEPVGPVPVSEDLLRQITQLIENERLPGNPELGASLVIRVHLPPGR